MSWWRRRTGGGRAACAEARDAELLGAGDPATAARVARHLGRCDDCQAERARLEAVRSGVRLESAPLDDLTRARILDRLASAVDDLAAGGARDRLRGEGAGGESRGVGTQGGRSGRRGRWVVVVGAAVSAMAVLLMWLRLEEREDPAGKRAEVAGRADGAGGRTPLPSRRRADLSPRTGRGVGAETERGGAAAAGGAETETDGGLAVIRPYGRGAGAVGRGELRGVGVRRLVVGRGERQGAELGERTRLLLVGPAELEVVAAGAEVVQVRLVRGELVGEYRHGGGGRLRILSPGTTTEIVGTTFYVEARGSGSRVAVADGRVLVHGPDQRERLVPAGQVWSSARAPVSMHRGSSLPALAPLTRDIVRLFAAHAQSLSRSSRASPGATPPTSARTRSRRLPTSKLALATGRAASSPTGRATQPRTGSANAASTFPTTRPQTGGATSSPTSRDPATDNAAASTTGLATGPLTGSAASARTGSATQPRTGSAAASPTGPATGPLTGATASTTGPATGNAAPSTTGPATGSAAPSTTGPATGNAAPSTTGPATGSAASAPTGVASRVQTGGNASSPTSPLDGATGGASSSGGAAVGGGGDGAGLYGRAEGAMRRGDVGEARRWLLEVVGLPGVGGLAAVAGYELAQLAVRAGDLDEARARLAPLRMAGASDLAEPAAFLACEIELRAGDLTRARRCYARFRERHVGSVQDAEALGALLRLAPPGGDCGPTLCPARRISVPLPEGATRAGGPPPPGGVRAMNACSNRLAGLVLACLVAVGCEMRVVELTRAGDAGGRDGGTDAVTCDRFVRDDGIACRICFAESGAITSMTCDPLPPPGPPSVLPMCRVIRGGDDRCLICPAMDAGTYMACLQCDPPAPSSAGGQCRACAWSDDSTRRCVQCFAADGTRTEDSCDNVRGGPMTILPAPAADAGSAR